MARCLICGQPMVCGQAVHTGCMEQRMHKLRECICDEYCRYPHEITDEQSLLELHCSECKVMRMIGAGDLYG